MVSSTNRSDVLIVGAGVIGLSTALALHLAGRSVRVIEARTVGSGSSHGNCGTITPSHAPPLAAPGLVARALGWSLRKDAPLYIPPRFDPALWRWLLQFARHCNPKDWHASALAKAALLNDSRLQLAGWVQTFDLNCEFQETGEDYVFRERNAFLHGQEELDVLTECGVKVEVVAGSAYEAMEPSLKKGVAGALRFHGDASVRPDSYVAELARYLRSAGVLIEERTSLLALTSASGEWTARTNHGDFAARDVVVCIGAWTPTLREAIGHDAPWLRAIQPGKGYSITYSKPAVVPSRPIVLRERAVCVSSWGDAFRVGSTMEFSGFDASLNRSRLNAITKAADDYLLYPRGPEILEEWYGWRPMSSDDVPLIGAVPGASNLWINAGHGMMGMSMSTSSALLLSALMTGSATGVDASPYSPQRFMARTASPMIPGKNV